MGSGCSKGQKNGPKRNQGILQPSTRAEMAKLDNAEGIQDIHARAAELNEAKEQAAVDEEEDVKDSTDRLKEWFRTFNEETEVERRGVQSWARLCIWRYFWDYLFEVSYKEKLTDIQYWGRPIPSIHERHQSLKRLAEHTLKKMEPTQRERVFKQLCAFSELQGPDVYWNEDLRHSGVDALKLDDLGDTLDLKALNNNFGVLRIDLFREKNLPFSGKWVSSNYTGDFDGLNDQNQESSDYVLLSLVKNGWDDLKLLTAVNNHKQVIDLREKRQRIRMLHGRKVRVLMKNCLHCTASMVRDSSMCYVTGVLELNENILSKAPYQILDYNPSFRFKIKFINPDKIDRCHETRCKGNVPSSLSELDPDQFFITSLINDNTIPYAVDQAWKAALARRRTCGLSMAFYSTIYASKDMPKQSIETCGKVFKGNENEYSDLYQALFEDTQPSTKKALNEVYKRMRKTSESPDRAYWFKFWVTASKAILPNSNQVPALLWPFDFINNPKAVCYNIMEREPLEALITRSKVFDNASLYLSAGHSVEKVFETLYKNIKSLKLKGTDNYDNKQGTNDNDKETTNGEQQQDGMMSPNMYGMMSPQFGGMMSPNMYGMMSPQYGGMMSPNMYGMMSPNAFMSPVAGARRGSILTMPPSAMAGGHTPQVHAMSMNNNSMGGSGGLGVMDIMKGSSDGQTLAPLPNTAFGMTPHMAPSANMFIHNQQNANMPNSSEEFDLAAAQSQECMRRLISIQSAVTDGSLTKDEARQEMASLALQFPILLQAIGGFTAVNAMEKNPTSMGTYNHKRKISGDLSADGKVSRNMGRRASTDGGELESTAISAVNGAVSAKNGRHDLSHLDEHKTGVRSNPLSGESGLKGHRDYDDEDDSEDNAAANTPGHHQAPNYEHLDMKKPKLSNRMCATVTDNGVNTDEITGQDTTEEEKKEDECTIM